MKTTIGLLWGLDDAPRRGPRQRFTTTEIVGAATAVADRDGLDGLSMRRVAQDLGVTAMTLYTYVPGKDELVELMLDAAYLAMPREPHGRRRWRARVRQVAEDNRALYERHPWAAQVSFSRPPLGPGLMAKYEHELRAFDDTGLGDVDRDAALTFVLDFARAAARSALQAAAAPGTDAAWWEANAPLLERVLDPDRYPTASRVGTAAGEAQGGAYDAGRAWTFGLERVLDGLAALIEPSAS